MGLLSSDDCLKFIMGFLANTLAAESSSSSNPPGDAGGNVGIPKIFGG